MKQFNFSAHIVLFFLCTFILFVSSLNARDTHTITGEVKHSQTEEIVENVTVFLDGTTFTAQTNEQGQFTLSGIPDGHYVLVGYKIGFKTATIAFNLPSDYDEITLFIENDPTAEYDKNETDVIMDGDGWNQQVSIFKDIILSKTPFAQRSTILNPHDLVFEDERPILRATARRSLIIENLDLNYDLEVVLKSFDFDRVNRTFSFELYSRFIDVPASSSRLQKRVESTRNNLYQGSANQFLRLLYNTDQTLKGGRLGDFEILILSSLNVLSPEQYMYELSDGSRTWRRSDIKPDRLFSTGENGEKMLNRNVIFLRYLKKGEHVNYLEETKRTGSESIYQYSVLTIQEDVEIGKNGVLVNPGAANFYGYLAWKRLADFLPLEFITSE